MPLITLVVKIIDLFEAFLDYFVSFAVQWDKEGPGAQWTLAHYHSEPTDKGIAVLDAVVTIIHHGLDFVAQLTTLLPAQEGTYHTNF